MPNDDIMTVKELADYLKVTEKIPYRFASESKVAGLKMPSLWPFRGREIESWISRQKHNKEEKHDRKRPARSFAATNLANCK